jgi:hypothetical protein
MDEVSMKSSLWTSLVKYIITNEKYYIEWIVKFF